VLVLILSALMLIHYFPGLATLIWSVALLGGAIWLVLTGRKYYRFIKQERTKQALAQSDEREFLEYETQVAALKATRQSSSADLEEQLAQLQQQHRPMLNRRYGPH